MATLKSVASGGGARGDRGVRVGDGVMARRRLKKGRDVYGHDYAKTRARMRAAYRRLRDEWIESQGRVCARCGTREPEPYRGQRGVWCDGWHLSHKDHRTKVTHRVFTLGTDRRAAELVKCELWCGRCNLDEANGRRWAKSPDELEEAPF